MDDKQGLTPFAVGLLVDSQPPDVVSPLGEVVLGHGYAEDQQRSLIPYTDIKASPGSHVRSVTHAEMTRYHMNAGECCSSGRVPWAEASSDGLYRNIDQILPECTCDSWTSRLRGISRACIRGRARLSRECCPSGDCWPQKLGLTEGSCLIACPCLYRDNPGGYIPVVCFQGRACLPVEPYVGIKQVTSRICVVLLDVHIALQPWRLHSVLLWLMSPQMPPRMPSAAKILVYGSPMVSCWAWLDC